jgi:hypothetical protein
MVAGENGGRVAQLGERLVRNEEAGGSNPLSSTKNPHKYWRFRESRKSLFLLFALVDAWYTFCITDGERRSIRPSTTMAVNASSAHAKVPHGTKRLDSASEA